MKKTFLIIAGETSGDKHAAVLIDNMKRIEDIRVVGIGGDRMKAAGVELLHHVKEMSVMGFSEVITKLPFFAGVRSDLIEVVKEEKPTAVILVDYPGFNLRFAKLAKREGLHVFYYISPQVWAWGKRRIRTIRRSVDLMLTIFKFEEEIYRRDGVNARFVGHPLLDETKIPDVTEVAEFRDRLLRSSLNSGSKKLKLLALLPGSRVQEVKMILPTMLDAVRILKNELHAEGIELRAAIGCAPVIDEGAYSEIIAKSGVRVDLCHDVDLLMESSDAGMITSGTATLEAALHGLPMLVAYRTSPLTYLLGRFLVRLTSISLVNIVAQERVVEELVQNKFKARNAADIIKTIITNTEVSDEIKRKYGSLRQVLGMPGASARAAELILRAV